MRVITSPNAGPRSVGSAPTVLLAWHAFGCSASVRMSVRIRPKTQGGWRQMTGFGRSAAQVRIVVLWAHLAPAVFESNDLPETKARERHAWGPYCPPDTTRGGQICKRLCPLTKFDPKGRHAGFCFWRCMEVLRAVTLNISMGRISSSLGGAGVRPTFDWRGTRAAFG